jgi:putative cell wall-binding protein
MKKLSGPQIFIIGITLFGLFACLALRPLNAFSRGGEEWIPEASVPSTSLPKATVPSSEFSPVEGGYTNPTPAEIAVLLEETAEVKGIPAEILKSVAYAESGWRQWDEDGRAVGDTLGDSVPPLGIMQVAEYDPNDFVLTTKLKYDISFNIAYAADLLNTKYASTPTIGAGERDILENWYFALWAYDDWSNANNPADLAGTDTQPYQERVFHLAGEGFPVWSESVAITPLSPDLFAKGHVPDTNATFVTPTPAHLSEKARLSSDLLLAGVYPLYDEIDPLAVEEITATPALNPQTTPLVPIETPLSTHPLKVWPKIDESLLSPLTPGIQEIVEAEDLGIAAQTALAQWLFACETVIVTGNADYADALAGISLARYYRAPILLTSALRLDADTAEAIRIIAPRNLIILGGESMVSSAVEKTLRAGTQATVRRIAGRDRYETAALIASELPPSYAVAIASGTGYQDALAMAAAAALQGIPLLLTEAEVLPSSTLEMLTQLRPQQIYIAGDSWAVGNVVENTLRNAPYMPEVKRLAGVTHAETSALLVAEFYPAAEIVFLTPGRNFAETIAAGAAAVNRDAGFIVTGTEIIAPASPLGAYLRSIPTEASLILVSTKKDNRLYKQLENRNE